MHRPKHFSYRTFTLLLLLIGIKQLGKTQHPSETDTQLSEESFFAAELDSLTSNSMQYEKTKNFYDSLKARAEKRSWTKSLHDLLIMDKKKSSANIQGYEHSVPYQTYAGRVIRDIHIKQVEVFGQSVYDTSMQSNIWIHKLGNQFHMNTHEQIILNELFIEEGSRLNPQTLSDNERIIREMPSILDVAILVEPIGTLGDTVDLTIITRDVWPIGVNLEVLDYNYGNLSFWTSNLMGLGHEASYTGYYHGEKSPKYGYAATYKVNSIGSTFIDAEIGYLQRWNTERYRFSLQRPFFTPEIKYAGGFLFEDEKSLLDIITIDSIYPEQNIDYAHYDAWLGYSRIIPSLVGLKTRTNTFLTARYYKYHFRLQPKISNEFLYNYSQRQGFLASFGITEQGFYKTKLVYGFGTPEDIPYGSTVALIAGYELNEFKDRPYFGLHLKDGRYYEKLGFISHDFQIGGFLDNNFEQGAVYYNLKYFSPVFAKNLYRFRAFSSFKYQLGYNRFGDEFVKFDKKEGIRGTLGERLIGNELAYLNNELVCFSPHYLYGFRFVYFSFLDFGVINFENDRLLKNPIQTGIGLGVRIRNERFVLNTIQFRLSYFFNTPKEIKHEYIELTSYPKVRPDDYGVHRPEFVNY